MAKAQAIPVEGSIQWAMNRRTLYRVDGINKYGNMVTWATTAGEAAEMAMYRGERYSLWVPSGTQLTVWNVYAGEIGGFSMKDPQRFVVRRGQVFETGEKR